VRLRGQGAGLVNVLSLVYFLGTHTRSMGYLAAFLAITEGPEILHTSDVCHVGWERG